MKEKLQSYPLLVERSDLASASPNQCNHEDMTVPKEVNLDIVPVGTVSTHAHASRDTNEHESALVPAGHDDQATRDLLMLIRALKAQNFVQTALPDVKPSVASLLAYLAQHSLKKALFTERKYLQLTGPMPVEHGLLTRADDATPLSPRGGLQPLPLPPTPPRVSTSTGGNSTDGSEFGDGHTANGYTKAAPDHAKVSDMNGHGTQHAIPKLHPASSVLNTQPSRPEASGASTASEHAQYSTAGVLAVRSKLECLRMGMCTAQGQRNHMEDFAFIMHLAMPHSMSSWFQHGACFGVFDGHGGHEVAQNLAENVPRSIQNNVHDLAHGGPAGVEHKISSILQQQEETIKSWAGVSQSGAARTRRGMSSAQNLTYMGTSASGDLEPLHGPHAIANSLRRNPYSANCALDTVSSWPYTNSSSRDGAAGGHDAPNGTTDIIDLDTSEATFRTHSHESFSGHASLSKRVSAHLRDGGVERRASWNSYLHTDASGNFLDDPSSSHHGKPPLPPHHGTSPHPHRQSSPLTPAQLPPSDGGASVTEDDLRDRRNSHGNASTSGVSLPSSQTAFARPHPLPPELHPHVPGGGQITHVASLSALSSRHSLHGLSRLSSSSSASGMMHTMVSQEMLPDRISGAQQLQTLHEGGSLQPSRTCSTVDSPHALANSPTNSIPPLQESFTPPILSPTVSQLPPQHPAQSCPIQQAAASSQFHVGSPPSAQLPQEPRQIYMSYAAACSHGIQRSHTSAVAVQASCTTGTTTQPVTPVRTIMISSATNGGEVHRGTPPAGVNNITASSSTSQPSFPDKLNQTAGCECGTSREHSTSTSAHKTSSKVTGSTRLVIELLPPDAQIEGYSTSSPSHIELPSPHASAMQLSMFHDPTLMAELEKIRMSGTPPISVSARSSLAGSSPVGSLLPTHSLSSSPIETLIPGLGNCRITMVQDPPSYSHDPPLTSMSSAQPIVHLSPTTSDGVQPCGNGDATPANASLHGGNAMLAGAAMQQRSHDGHCEEYQEDDLGSDEASADAFNADMWEQLMQGRDPGSTALVVVIFDCNMYVANVGDCRLIVAEFDPDKQHAVPKIITKDHIPTVHEEEAARLAKLNVGVSADGYVGASADCSGYLQVSRSIGDFSVKNTLGESVILSDPELHSVMLGPQSLFAVAASDGITSAMDNETIINEVCKYLNKTNDPQYAAQELVNYAINVKGSADNASAVITCFKKDAPPMPPGPPRRRFFSSASRAASAPPSDMKPDGDVPTASTAVSIPN